MDKKSRCQRGSFWKLSVTAVMAGALMLGSAVPGNATAPATPGGESPSKHETKISQAEIDKAIAEHFKNSKPGPYSSETISKQSAVAGLFAPSGPDVKSVQYNTENPTPLLTCYASGSTCGFSQSVSSSWTVTGSAGVDFKALTASVSGSYSQTYTSQVNCTSPKLAWNQKYVATARGTFVIFDWVTRVLGVETGRQRATAFLPTGIGCKVVKYK